MLRFNLSSKSGLCSRWISPASSRCKKRVWAFQLPTWSVSPIEGRWQRSSDLGCYTHYVFIATYSALEEPSWDTHIPNRLSSAPLARWYFALVLDQDHPASQLPDAWSCEQMMTGRRWRGPCSRLRLNFQVGILLWSETWCSAKRCSYWHPVNRSTSMGDLGIYMTCFKAKMLSFWVRAPDGMPISRQGTGGSYRSSRWIDRLQRHRFYARSSGLRQQTGLSQHPADMSTGHLGLMGVKLVADTLYISWCTSLPWRTWTWAIISTAERHDSEVSSWEVLAHDGLHLSSQDDGLALVLDHRAKARNDMHVLPTWAPGSTSWAGSY